MAEDDRPVGDKSMITATQWEAAALASALLAVGIGLLGSLWIFGWIGETPKVSEPAGVFAWLSGPTSEAEEMRARAQAFTPIGAFMIAIVTFCTVAWRAKVTERQASAQERQLESADENNLAILLQKGAELLSDKDEGKLAAGLACLEAVAIAKNKRFGTQAMDLIAKYIEREHQSGHFHYLCTAAIAALHLGSENGLRSNMHLSFKNADNEKEVDWIVIPGVRGATYANGLFMGIDFNNISKSSNFRFVGCEIYDSKNIDISRIFRKCEFHSCVVSTCNTAYFFPNHYFGCNFSGVEFDNVKPHHLKRDVSSKLDSCYYFENTPPTSNSKQFQSQIFKALESRAPPDE